LNLYKFSIKFIPEHGTVHHSYTLSIISYLAMPKLVHGLS